MTPEQIAGLRTLASALSPGSPMSVPREWVLELVDRLGSRHTDSGSPDLTVTQVAERFGRAPSTVRGWVGRGLLVGAYRFQGREIRVPVAALAAFEASQRPGAAESSRPAVSRRPKLVDWDAFKHAS
jgi:hypothetical protein